MTKHLSIQKLLAALLTSAALFAGQQAFATMKTMTYTLSKVQQSTDDSHHR